MSTATTAVLGKPRSSGQTTAAPAALWAMIGVLALAHLPLLIAHGQSLWKREHYQLFPLVLIFAAILAKPAWETARMAPAGPAQRRVGLWLLGLNWLILSFAVMIDSPVLGAFAFWILLIATAYATGGWPTLRAAIPALAYLLLIIPPPFNLDARLVMLLQTYTSTVGSRVLDLMGTYHAINGVIIEVGDKKYEIEHACSGISSLLSVLACTLFYVFWMGAHWLRGILLVLSAVFWVLMANVLRVVTIVFFDTQFGVDLSVDSFPFYLHTLLGILLFALTLALVASTDRLLMFLGTTVSWGSAKNKVSAPLRPSGAEPLSVTWGLFVPVALAYGVLMVFQAGDYGIGESIPESKLISSYNAFSASTMPDELLGWKKSTGSTAFAVRDSKEIFDNYGEHSRTWRYQNQRGNLAATVSFDYPFPFWHDLRMCYQSTGWQIMANDEFNHTLSDNTGEVSCMWAHMTRPVERNAYLWFGEFDLNGRYVESKMPGGTNYRFARRFDSIKSRWDRLTGKQVDPETRAFNILQVQVLTETVGTINANEKKELQQFFTASLETMRRKCLEVLKAAANR
jgi:exosortase